MLRILEVGGTHVTAAVVDPGDLHIVRSERIHIDSGADAETLIAAFVSAVEGLNWRTSRLVVAIPGPFDYVSGIGDFEGVAKFGDLKGVPLGDELAHRLGTQVSFINDVTAYGIGQYVRLHQPRRLVTLTLGTGVGSAFLDDGVPVEAGPLVPRHGWVYTLEHNGRPIEETFSRRAIVAAYQDEAGREADVADVARLAVDGDPIASRVLQGAYVALAETVSPWLIGFRTEVLVLGGSIAQTWELVQRWFEPAVEGYFRRYRTKPPQIAHGEGGEEAALIGAALHSRRAS